jgi:hypothetical protein
LTSIILKGATMPGRAFRSSLSLGGRCCGAIVVVCGSAFAISGTAEAAPAYEGFDYPIGTKHANFTGGTGFRPSSGSAASTVAPGSLSDPTGTLLTSGGHIEGTGGSRATLLGYSAERRDLIGNGDFWLSFLMRQNAINPGAPSGMYMTADGGGLYFIGQPAGFISDPPGANTFAIGGGGGDFTRSDVPFESNRDYFLVAHFQRGTGNDLATLYMNPTPGVTPPTGGTTFTGVDFVGSLPSFEFLAFGPAAQPNFIASFDEFRVGTTYADVAPVVPEPATSFTCFMVLSTLALRRRRRGPGAPRRTT